MKALRPLILFGVGGLLYVLIELLWRGYSHWTMFLVGGFCFVAVGLINERLSWETPFVIQCIIGGTVITAVEFISGCIINLWLGWDVWDYSDLPFNILGQICLPFFFIWVFISAPAILLDDWIRYLLYIALHDFLPMQERERPHYRFL